MLRIKNQFRYKWLIFLLCLISNNISANEPTKKRPTVAVVLSGGGAKGFAHIGVLKVLEAYNIPVDIVVGTSIGSIVGGLYSIGYAASEIEVLANTQDWSKVLSDDVDRKYLSPIDDIIAKRYLISIDVENEKGISAPLGFVKGQNVLNLFCNLSSFIPDSADFTKFEKKFACIATNLETGEEEVITSGNLPTAILSSMAVPAFFYPVKRDGKLLIDGGIRNNYPADVAKQLGADIIIGVDIQEDLKDVQHLESIGDIVNQLIGFFSDQKFKENKEISYLIIRPNISEYSSLSFSKNAVKGLISRGETAANSNDKVLTVLSNELAHQTITSPDAAKRLKDNWLISDVRFLGNYTTDKSIIERAFHLKTPKVYTSEDITKAIDRLYGNGFYEKIYYSIEEQNGQATLLVHIDEKQTSTHSIGLNFNSIDAARILLNSTFKNHKKSNKLLYLGAELSAHPAFDIIGEVNRKNSPTVGFKLSGKLQNYDVHIRNITESKADLLYTSADAYMRIRTQHLGHIRAGVRLQYYYGSFYGNIADSSLSNQQFSGEDTFTKIYARYKFDNLDNFYYPRRGAEFVLQATLTSSWTQQHLIMPTTSVYYRHAISFSSKFTAIPFAQNRIIYSKDYAVYKSTVIGGEPYAIYFDEHLAFFGLSPITVVERQATVVGAELRFQAFNKTYISLIGNGIAHYDVFKQFENANTILGCGLRISYNSKLGPIDLSVSGADHSDRVVYGLNIGYWY